MLNRALCLVSCFVVAVLKIVIILEQGGLHFQFAPGPMDYGASPAGEFPELNSF